jgi:hypothetical protein
MYSARDYQKSYELKLTIKEKQEVFKARILPAYKKEK